MMLRARLLAAWLCLLPVTAMVQAQGPCPPATHDKAALEALKSNAFAVPDAARKRALAQDLVACLGSADPALRDGIAFEALSAWMRAGDFDPTTLRGLRDALYALLDGEAGEGYARPFAALVLSEVARTDRIAPWMSAQERDLMVDKAAGYVASVRDYRGYDDAQGWRHGVAHGADWLMQLALHPALDRAQADRILSAVATQAVPASAHAYVYGEPGRLARPVLFVAQRALLSDADWRAWFAALPPKLGDAALAYKDSGWLARRHDLMAFLTALYVDADGSADAGIRALKPAVVEAMKAVP